MAQGKRTPLQVYEWIDRFLRQPGHADATAPDIRRAMEESPLADLTPSENKIRDIVKELRDQSPPWKLEEAADVDAALVLPVLGAILEDSAGSVRSLSKAESAWITAIRRAAPDIPLLWAYYMARHYLVAKAQGVSTDGHDRFLALRLWEDEERRVSVAEQGIVPLLGRYVFLTVQDTLGGAKLHESAVTFSGDLTVKHVPARR